MLKPKENDDFFIRRSMALTSFLTVLALIPALILIGIYISPDQAPMFQAIMPILVITIPALIAVITHYMHQAHSSKDAD